MNLKYKLFGLRFSVPIKSRTVSISADRIKAAVLNPFLCGLKDIQTGNYELFVESLQNPAEFKSIGSKQVMIKTDYDNPYTNLFNKDFIKDSDLLSVFDEWNKGIFNV